MNAVQTVTADLKVGDRITEIDTPEGPYYLVVKVNPRSFLLDISPMPLGVGTVRAVGDTLRMASSRHTIVLKAI